MPNHIPIFGCTALYKILAKSFGRPACAGGYSLRQLNGSQFYEACLDLRWRLIFKMCDEEIVLFDVMNHDQVRRL